MVGGVSATWQRMRKSRIGGARNIVVVAADVIHSGEEKGGSGGLSFALAGQQGGGDNAAAGERDVGETGGVQCDRRRGLNTVELLGRNMYGTAA